MSAIDGLKNASPEDLHQRRVDAFKGLDRAKRQARREVDAEEHPPKSIPTMRTLAERLSVKPGPIRWRITDWMKEGYRVLLSAQYKAGKTTLVINVVRALVDDVPFLDRFDVSPVNAVTVLDFEMADDEPNQLDEWYQAAAIKHADRVRIVALRGRASSFNILDPVVRTRWAALLKGTEFLIIDCLRPILDALGLDESHEAGKFYVALDELLNEAGIRNAIVVHHMGHQNERARGDSRNLDWPDVNWTLVRESEDPASPRFIKAFGRGIDMPETKLQFNPKMQRLSIGHGSRKDAKLEEVIDAVLEFVAKQQNSPSQKDIRDNVKADAGFSDSAIRNAISKAKKRGDLQEDDVPGKNKKVYSIPPPPPF
jgi:hypothetical protein